MLKSETGGNFKVSKRDVKHTVGPHYAGVTKFELYHENLNSRSTEMKGHAPCLKESRYTCQNACSEIEFISRLYDARTSI